MSRKERCDGCAGDSNQDSNIAAFGRLVAQVMIRRPYRCAPRVFWIMDNGSSHRGARCIERLQRPWPNLIPIHTPVHASWLNQVETYFSVVQHKALTPNDFLSLGELEQRLLAFQGHYESIARLFNGDLHDAICAAPCSSSTPLAPGLPGPPDARQIRHRTFGPEYLASADALLPRHPNG